MPIVKPSTELMKAPILKLYQEGLSTRDIGHRLNIGKSTVAKVIKEAGVGRNHVESANLSKYKYTIDNPTHWRTCRARAREIMEKHLGRKLESYEHVHHIDKDFTNLNIENLEVKLASDHVQDHGEERRGPEYGIPKSQRASTKEYMKKYNREYYKSHRGK